MREQMFARVAPDDRAAFAAWLEGINEQRAEPLKESEALRVLVLWAARTRPDFDELNRAAARGQDKSRPYSTHETPTALLAAASLESHEPSGTRLATANARSKPGLGTARRPSPGSTGSRKRNP